MGKTDLEYVKFKHENDRAYNRERGIAVAIMAVVLFASALALYLSGFHF
ncbi:MAG: hypothetical protein ACM3KM_04205 [Acidobacteriaceae bacterium]